jgi:signal peptidase I
MIPTLEVGDHIFVSKFSYGFVVPFTNKKVFQYTGPKRGDVIVFKYPRDPETDYIKRVIGLPGDNVEVRRNEVFINGHPVERELDPKPCLYEEGQSEIILDGTAIPRERECERWIESLDGRRHVAIQNVGELNHTQGDWGPLAVPPGHYFVMGDNRDNSSDSRVWGMVPQEYIKGRALIVWWSRGNANTSLSPNGIAAWFKAIHWRRFFHVID